MNIELKAPFNAQKYIDALDHILGSDNAYYQGDKDVDTIVELIGMAKAYEDLIVCQQEEIEGLRRYINQKLNGTINLISAYDIECAKSKAIEFFQQKQELEKLEKEAKITRAYLHDNGLEFDLLSYSQRNGGGDVK